MNGRAQGKEDETKNNDLVSFIATLSLTSMEDVKVKVEQGE
jgi:hypothetical protein